MEVESAEKKVEDTAGAKEPAVRKEGEATSAAGEKATQAGHRSVQFPCFHLFTESNIDILTQLVTKYSIPRKYHFPLLMRIRLARAFPDVQARRDLVRTNLLAFTVLAQAHMDLGTLSSFFLYEPEFIAELMELVKSDRHTPQDFRILALDALSALTTDRSRLPKVIAATGSSQHHGELPSMVRKSVATLTGSVEHPIYTLPFIDSLFSFLAALMATPDGIAALNTAGIISTLLPLLRHQNLEHASVLMQCLSILEYYVAGSNSAAAVSLFRDLGGLDLLIERFNTEIASVQKAKEQENAGMIVEGASEIDAKDKGKERVDTKPATTANESSSSQQEEEGEEEESHLSHHQRTLVKTILRILLPFIQGGGRRNIGRLTGVIEGPFPRALCYVMEHYHYFGERIFSLGTYVPTVMHQSVSVLIRRMYLHSRFDHVWADQQRPHAL
jgi:E3 ubiquitin-protein ligase HUWE1